MQKESGGNWAKIYELWLNECPLQMFRLSPRAINLKFSEYTKDSQTGGGNKNYNRMVDQVMELSTTYAMIPGDSKENKKRRANGVDEGMKDEN